MNPFLSALLILLEITGLSFETNTNFFSGLSVDSASARFVSTQRNNGLDKNASVMLPWLVTADAFLLYFAIFLYILVPGHVLLKDFRAGEVSFLWHPFKDVIQVFSWIHPVCPASFDYAVAGGACPGTSGAPAEEPVLSSHSNR